MSAGYRPVSGLHVRPFDTAAREPCYLAEAGGRRWQINAATEQLLAALAGADSLEAAADGLARRWGREVRPADLAAHLERSLVPLGLVLRPGEGAESAPSERRFGGRLSYLSLRRTLVPERVLVALSRPARWLVHPRAFWPVFASLLAAAVWFVLSRTFGPGAAPLFEWMLAPGAIALGMASTLVHELGHAAACRRFGCRHGNLGFGLYLVFPVLYMEVDETWRLSRNERAIVAAAGMYFQLLFGAGVLAAGYLHPPFLPLAAGAAGIVCLDLATNLNPIFRFDGYWLVSDLLGIPNLRRKSVALAGAAWRGLRGRSSPAEVILPGGISPARTAVLGLYAGASVAFFAVFLGNLLLVLPRFAVVRYPLLMAGHGASLRAALESGHPFAAAWAVLSMVPPTMVLVSLPLTLALLAVRLARRRVPGALPSFAPLPRTPS